MKLLKSLAILLLPVAAFGQVGKYSINGKIGKLNSPAKAYLIYRTGKATVTDTALIKNGTFRFKGEVADPIKARLIVDHKDVGLKNLRVADNIEIYLESGTIAVTTADSIAKAVITGSKVNAENKKLTALTAATTSELKALYTKYTLAKSDSLKNAIEKEYDKIDEQRKAIVTQFIKDNPNSFVSIDIVKGLAGSTPEVDKIEPLYNLLSANLKGSTTGKELGDKISKLKRVMIGAMAPEFSQADTAQIQVKLSDFKGKYVLIDFWASWCGPCRRENPNVVKAFNQFKSKNFTILGVSLDRNREAWLKAIAADHLTWTHVSDIQYWNNEVAQLYSVQSIPANFLIDPNGRIIGKNLRGEELENKLTEVLK